MSVIYNVLLSPAKAFEAIKEKPRWWQGLFIVVALIILGDLLGTWGAHDFIVKMAQERMAQMTPEQAEAAAKWLTLPVMLGSTAINKLILVPLIVLVQATVFHLMTPLAGGEASFKRAFGVVVWSKMTIVLGSWITGLATLAMREPFRTDLGLAVDINSKLQGALSQVELFSLWSLVLVAEGMHRVLGCKRSLSYIVVFGLWVLWVGISFGVGAFRGG